MLLKEFPEPAGITQTQFAQHISWTYARLNEIINGKRGVSADSALALSEALGTTSEFYTNADRPSKAGLICAKYSTNKIKKKCKLSNHNYFTLLFMAVTCEYR